MLNMVNKNEKQANEGEKKTTGEIGLSGSMTRQVSLSPFHPPSTWSPFRPRVVQQGGQREILPRSRAHSPPPPF